MLVLLFSLPLCFKVAAIVVTENSDEPAEKEEDAVTYSEVSMMSSDTDSMKLQSPMRTESLSTSIEAEHVEIPVSTTLKIDLPGTTATEVTIPDNVSTPASSIDDKKRVSDESVLASPGTTNVTYRKKLSVDFISIIPSWRRFKYSAVTGKSEACSFFSSQPKASEVSSCTRGSYL
jgi:hypothetical protein